MPEYGFYPYTEKYGPEKTRILTYFAVFRWKTNLYNKNRTTKFSQKSTDGCYEFVFSEILKLELIEWQK